MNARQRLVLLGIGLVLGLGAGAGHAQPPDQWRFDERGHFNWTSASFALNEDGTISDRLTDDLIRGVVQEHLERAEEHGSLADHGLENGDVPPFDLCGERTRWDYDDPWLVPEDFETILLMAEVGVVATVEKVHYGFVNNGTPGVLIELADSVALIPNSPLPSYVVLSVPRLVFRDTVYCRRYGPQETYTPERGERVVVVGQWGEGGIVPVGRSQHAGFATISEQGGLSWMHTVRTEEFADLDSLTAKIGEFEAAGLFGATRHLVRHKYFYGGRLEFADAVRDSHQSAPGCPISSISREDGRWSVKRVCPEREIIEE